VFRLRRAFFFCFGFILEELWNWGSRCLFVLNFFYFCEEEGESLWVSFVGVGRGTSEEKGGKWVVRLPDESMYVVQGGRGRVRLRSNSLEIVRFFGGREIVCMSLQASSL